MAQSIRSRSRSASNEPEPAEWPTSTSPSRCSPARFSPPPEQEVARARRRGHAPRMDEHRGPQLTPADTQRVNDFVTEPTAEIRGRERFQDFSPADTTWAAQTFVRYRIHNLASLRRKDKEARTMFIKDLREIERRSFPEMQLILLLLGHFAPSSKTAPER